MLLHLTNIVTDVLWLHPMTFPEISKKSRIQSKVECFSSANGGGKFHHGNNVNSKHIVYLKVTKAIYLHKRIISLTLRPLHLSHFHVMLTKITK